MGDESNFLENHIAKCRCCFQSLSDNKNVVKITKSVEKVFFELTQLELKSLQKIYSQKICQECDRNLKHFHKYRKELIRKQKKLYEFTEGDKIKNRPSRKRNEKKISTENDNETSSFEEEHRDIFVKLEVKEERDEDNNDSCIVLEPLTSIDPMMPYVKLEKMNMEEITSMPDHFYDSDSNNAQNFPTKEEENEEEEDDGVKDPFEEFFKNQEKAKKKNKYKRKKDRQPFNKVFCPYCDKFFLKEEKLKIHIDFVHFKLKNYKCTKCDFKTYSPAFLKGHDERVHSDKVIEPKPKPPKQPCPICGLLVQKTSTHIRNIHTRPKNVFCDICGYGIFNVNKLRRHMYKHLSKETKRSLVVYSCDLCGAKLHSKNSISSHMKNLHREKGKMYSCYCGKTYRAESYLKVHQRSHEKVLKHKCNHCDKAFMNLSQLKIHLEIHERGKRKDFSCEVCGKMYGTENLLHRHKIFHTEPTIPCNYCGKMFHRQCLLARHIRAQHEVELGECEYCGKQMNVISLQRHIKEFHSNLPRKLCPVTGCTSSFLRKCHLKDHIQRVHKDFLHRMTPDEKDAFEDVINAMNLI
ncbi:hypothetical protein PVAND_013629 [Polypedilum vanderplanki]|uniref:Zinc finger protein n=1 Tax=Polypedilum vanderplanki TaxID=319348 RepID=A0A9J6CQ03_POLVA|nr:hypothetical protein PVAND_013629 [Polypedilum vanderplanki]